MLSKKETMKLLEEVLELSQAEQTEAVIVETDSALTRFADNIIHQNVANHDVRLMVRAVNGKRIGIAGTNRIDQEGMKEVVERATEIAEVVEDTPDFKGLPEPGKVKEAACFDEATAECTAEERARIVERAVKIAKQNGAAAAGALSTTASALGVANSLGVRSYHAGTEASLNLTMTVGKGEGKTGSAARATRLSSRVGDIDVDDAAEEVARRAAAGMNAVDVEPGEYTVVLSPSAVATLVEFLSYLGFGAKAYQEKRSYMAGKLGLKITGKEITIVDDGTDNAGMPWPIDFEGMPKQRVVLIEKGVAKGVVHDSKTAGLENKVSTGHALPAKFATHGPQAWNVLMEGGDSSMEEMIASTKKGLLISDFHYVNVAEPMKTVLTGMTRFGTFLIENGKVTKPVRNMRFTQGVLEAFEHVEAISRKRDRFEGVVAPAMKITGFAFTGKTEF